MMAKYREKVTITGPVQGTTSSGKLNFGTKSFHHRLPFFMGHKTKSISLDVHFIDPKKQDEDEDENAPDRDQDIKPRFHQSRIMGAADGAEEDKDDEDDEDEDKEVNMEKLRAYERNKLKYYYAVVECDTKETANHLNTQCDGMELERATNTLDLRFILDDMEFVREPRDVAKKVPQEGYKALEFETRALQHRIVKQTLERFLHVVAPPAEVSSCRIRCMELNEGRPTDQKMVVPGGSEQISGFILKTRIDSNHIEVCKPVDRHHRTYEKLVQFLKAIDLAEQSDG